jgi:hypothetical protein
LSASGNGGLEWNKVKPLIEKALSDLTTEVIVYEPNAEIQETLRKEEKPSAARLT